MDAIAPQQRWFHGGFELRDLPRAGVHGPSSVKLWLGATDRAEASRISASLEARWSGRGARARRITQRRPLTSVVPGMRGVLPRDLDELAARPWEIVEGCLVQVAPDADAIAAEWMEISGGNISVAEQSINRIHLWDLLDDEEPGDARADLAAATALAHAWQWGLRSVPGVERVVVELTVSPDGPELTVFRADAVRGA